MDICTSNIVIFALSKWDGAYSSTTFSLAKEFSKSNNVIYIDRPITFKDYIADFFTKNKIRKIKKSRLERLNDKLHIFYPPIVIPNNFLPKNYLYKKIKAINEKIIFKSLKKHLTKINFQNFIYINIFNPFFDHSKHISPICNIYYTVDNIEESAYVKKHGVWLEPELIRKSDVTLATSIMLLQKNKIFNDNIFYLPNAADLQIFNSCSSYEKPKELKGIESSIITFVGHLDYRTDIEILETIAIKHFDKTLLIIGPISLPKDTIDQLHSIENILFVGTQPIEKIPAFLKFSHCAIIPFKCNDLTKGIYPLKINEYLAMGLPVISTCFSEDIQKFENVISLAKNSSEFSNLIEFELASNGIHKEQQRIKIANENTWSKRVIQFWEILKSVHPFTDNI